MRTEPKLWILLVCMTIQHVLRQVSRQLLKQINKTEYFEWDSMIFLNNATQIIKTECLKTSRKRLLVLKLTASLIV